MKNLSMLFICVCLINCIEQYNEKNVTGKYVPINYKNTFDTIILIENNTYHRKVYDKNKKNVLEMKGKWLFEIPNTIKMQDFYLNLDKDLLKFPPSLKDADMSVTTNFETKNNRIQFCVGYYEGDNCYEKIE